MPNYFDQFDEAGPATAEAPSGNFFDQFDEAPPLTDIDPFSPDQQNLRRVMQNFPNERAQRVWDQPTVSPEELIKRQSWKDLSAADKLAVDAIRLERGFKTTAAALPKGFAVHSAGQNPYNPPDVMGLGAPVTAQNEALSQEWEDKRAAMTGEQKQAEMEASSMWQLGKSIEKTIPDSPQPSNVNRPFGAAAEGVGSLGASMTLAPAGVAPMMSGMFLMELSDAYESEIARQQDTNEPLNPDKARAKASLYAAGAIPLEYIGGAGRLARRWFGAAAENEVRELARKGGGEAVLAFFSERAKDAALEGGTESLQRLWQDAIVHGKPNIAAALQEGASAAGGTLLLGGGIHGSRAAAIKASNAYHEARSNENIDQALQESGQQIALEQSFPPGFAPPIDPAQTAKPDGNYFDQFDDESSESQSPQNPDKASQGSNGTKATPAAVAATPAPAGASDQREAVMAELEALPGGMEDIARPGGKPPTVEQALSNLTAVVADLQAALVANQGNALLKPSVQPDDTGKPAQTITGSNVQSGTEMPVQASPGAAHKTSDENWQVSVQSPMQLGADTMPGYVQVDDVSGGQNRWSSNPDKLRSEGYDIPTTAELQKLPQGKYTLSQARAKLAQSSQGQPPVQTVAPPATLNKPTFAVGQKVAVRLSNRSNKEHLARITQLQPDGSAQVQVEGEKTFRMVAANQLMLTKTDRARRAKQEELATVPAEQQEQVKADAAEFAQVVEDYAPQLEWAPGEAYDRNTAMQEQGVENARLRNAAIERAMRTVLPEGQWNSVVDRARALPKLVEYLTQQFPGDNSIAKRRALEDFSTSETESSPALEQQQAIVDRLAASNPGLPELKGLRAVGVRNAGAKVQLRPGHSTGTGGKPSLPSAATAELAQLLERLYDLNIIFVDSAGALPFNGVKFVGTKTALIHVRSGKPMLTVAGHELLHHIKETHPGLYAELVEAVGEMDIAGYRSRLTDPAYAGKSDAQITEELLADLLGDSLADPTFLKSLAQQDPNLFKRFARIAIVWLDKLLDKLKGVGFSRYNVSQHIADIEAARESLRTMLVEAAKETQYRKAGIGEDVDTQEGGENPFSKERGSDTFSFDAPESVANQKSRLAAEKRKADEAKAKAAMQERAGAKLTGSDVDTTKEMFGAEVRQDKSGQGALFSKERKQTGSKRERNAANYIRNLLWEAGELEAEYNDALKTLPPKSYSLPDIEAALFRNGEKRDWNEIVRDEGDTAHGFNVKATPFEWAKQNHGTTDDINAAGYVLPSGEMLDFSERRHGGGGDRSLDHRNIQYEGRPSDGYEAMRQFIGMGGVRVDKSGAVDIGKMPTSSQISRLRELGESAGSLTVDLLDGKRKASFTTENIERGLGMIRRFYNGEELPEHQALFSKERNENPFYSRLTRAVELSQQGKASGAQWKATIRNSKIGSSTDEFALVGVNDLEDGKTYTKQEVLDYLKANEIQVNDVTLGSLSDADEARLTELFDAEQAGTLTDAEFAEQEHLQDAVKRHETHFSTYQLPGAKEGSYREVLLTVPDVPNARKFEPSKVDVRQTTRSVTQGSTSIWYDGKRLADYGDDPRLQSDGSYKQRSKDYWIGIAKDLFEKGDERNSIGQLGNGWKDGHSQYSDIANPIVRLRFNERTTADGKRMLFLEEVQAPQKGQFEKMPALFQKNWREIAFKWALRHAAENGFDAVGWTRGEQQAERYDLSKQVDGISYRKTSSGNYDLSYRKGEYDTKIEDRVAPDKLDSIVGKDITKKILAGEGKRDSASPSSWTEISGEGLKVGGEGLKKLYDVDFRNVVNNLPAVKKAGQKVGSEKVKVTEHNVNLVSREFPFTVEKPNGEEYESNFRTLEAAKEVADRIGGRVVETNRDSFSNIHAIAITPSIRESVMGGQALFSKARQEDLIPPAETKPFKKKALLRAASVVYRGSSAPKPIADIRDAGLTEQKHIEESARLAVNDLRAALYREFPKDKEAADKRLMTFLNGEADVSTVGSPAVQRHAANVRDFIDDLSGLAVTEGLVSGDMAKTWLGSRGEWLKRTYLAFDPTADWNYDALKRRVDKGDVEITRIWRGVENYLQNQNPNMDDGQIEAEMRSLINRQEVEDALGMSTIPMAGTGKRISVDTSSLLRRKNLPPEVREWMGEIKDPYAKVLQSSKWLGQFITRNITQRRMARIGLELGLLSEEKTGDYHVMLYEPAQVFVPEKDAEGNIRKTEGGESIGSFRTKVDRKHEPLAGYYTTPEFKAALEEFDARFNNVLGLLDFQSVLGKAYMGLTNIQKGSLVAWNPYSWGVNTIGGAAIVASSSAFNPIRTTKSFLRAYQAIRRGNKPEGFKTVTEATKGLFGMIDANATQKALQARADYLLGVQAGLTGKGVLQGDVRANTRRDVESGSGRRMVKAIRDILADRKADGAYVRLREALSDMWRTPGEIGIRFFDDVFRLTVFFNELEVAGKAYPSDSLKKRVDFAADRAANLYQNYDRLPKVLRDASRTGVLNTFVSFKAEMFRNAWWIAKYAREGMKSDNPALKADGYRKAVSLLALAIAPVALAALSRVRADIDDDEDKALKRQIVAPWDRAESLAYVYKGDGKYAYVPIGYLLPTFEVTRPVISAWTAARDPNPDEALKRLTSGWISDYFGPGAVAGPLIEGAANIRLGTGRKLTMAEGATGAKDRIGYVAENFTPKAFHMGVEAYRAATGQTGEFGRSYNLEEMRNKLMGFRQRTLDIGKAAPFVLRGLGTRWRDASAYENQQQRKLSGKATDATDYEKETKEDLKRLYKQAVQDLRTLGLTESQIKAIEKGKGMNIPKELRGE